MPTTPRIDPKLKCAEMGLNCTEPRFDSPDTVIDCSGCVHNGGAGRELERTDRGLHGSADRELDSADRGLHGSADRELDFTDRGRDSFQAQVAGTVAKLRRKPVIIATTVVALAIAAAAAAVGTGLFHQKPPAASAAHAPVLTVATSPASMHQMSREIAVNGTISAWDPITVGTEASGLAITAIMVEEGATVTRGQILATLDSSVIRPQLESEKARLKASLAGARKAVQPNRREDINSLNAAASQATASVQDQESALVQAQANLVNANANVQRYELLRQQGAVSQQELENRQMVAKIADAAVRSAEDKIKAARFFLRQAQERLAMANAGGRAEDIQIANANTEEIRANIKRLEAQLEQTTIRAPVNGLITRRDAHVGDISSTAKAMFLMARDSRFELRAQVPEADLSAIQPGQAVTIKSALTGGADLNGRVREICPLVDSDTRLATVRIDVPTAGSVKPGMYAEGRVQCGSYPCLTVPASALVSQDDRSIVYTLHDGQVMAHPVETGRRSGGLVEIKSGLRAGEAVVATGTGFLKDGDYVTVADPAASGLK